MDPIASVFDGWQITSVLGEGSYGKVYLATRSEFGVTYQTAIKHIGIPKDEAALHSLRSDGDYTDAVMGDLFYDLMERFVKEIRLMYELKGHTNIVSYEDHKVIKREAAAGYDIFIRMEKLDSVNDVIAQRELTQNDVVKLGVDVCKALEMLAARSVIHRDIKPGNLFLNKNGDYKLGDFGIARQIDANMSMKSGTFKFMAPEVFKGQPYDATADIYSLGIVLYRLLNANRSPFLPVSAERVNISDDEKAQTRRMNGEALPRPAYADDTLGQIVLRACAYEPNRRFQSAVELRAVLQQYAESSGARVLPVITTEAPPLPSQVPNIRYAADASEGATGGVFSGTPSGYQPPRTDSSEGATDGVFSETPRGYQPPRTNASEGATDGVFSGTPRGYQSPRTDASESATDGVFSGGDHNGYAEQAPFDGAYIFPNAEEEQSARRFDTGVGQTDYEPLEYGGYVFTCGQETNYVLYRAKLPSSERVPISNGPCRGYGMDNGQLFYATDDGIYRLFFNKDDASLVTGERAAFPVFGNGFLYYTALSGGIYRIKPDGSARTVVTHDNSWYLTLYGGKIFYCDAADGFSLCSVTADGTGKAQYGVRGCHYLRVYGNYAVYTHDSSDGAICKLNLRTKETICLNHEPSIVTALRNGRVYYKTDNYGMTHELRLDGR